MIFYAIENINFINHKAQKRSVTKLLSFGTINIAHVINIVFAIVLWKKKYMQYCRYLFGDIHDLLYNIAQPSTEVRLSDLTTYWCEGCGSSWSVVLAMPTKSSSSESQWS